MNKFHRPAKWASFPQSSTVAVTSYAELRTDAVRYMARLWHELRGSGAMPERSALNPRDFAAFARDVSLIRVVEGGRDYEFRIIGDAHVQAYRATDQGRLLSEIAAQTPNFGSWLKGTYDRVRTSGKPLCLQGLVGSEFDHAPFGWFESGNFPLGTGERDSPSVSHILTVAVYAERPPETNCMMII